MIAEITNIEAKNGRMLVATYEGAEYLVNVPRWRLEDKHFEVGHLVEITPRDGDQFAYLSE